MTDRHRRLAETLPEPAPPRVVDLGCGEGRTLLALRERFGEAVELVGVERKQVEIPVGQLVVADLNKPLPFEDESFGGAVCHNTLEALLSVDAFLDEVYRLLAPGGHFLLGHSDFDTMVFHASDLDLTRRFVHAFADTQEEWMDAADGTIGRKLPAIARRSRFELVSTMAWVLVDTELAQGEPADVAVEGIKGAVRRDHRELASQLEAWIDDLRVHAGLGEFLFSVNDYAVLLRRPA